MRCTVNRHLLVATFCFISTTAALPAAAKPLDALSGLSGKNKAECDQTLKVVQALERGGDSSSLDRAVALLQGLVAKNKGGFDVHLELGRIYARQGKEEQALYALTEALMMTVDDPANGAKAREEIASIYMKRGDYDEAGGEFKRVVEYYPDNMLARGNLGICYEQIGAYDQAIEQFQKVLAVNPNDFTALYNLGLAYFVKDDTDRAFQYFGQAISANPSNSRVSLAMLGIARCYEARGDLSRAQEVLEKVIKHDPTNQFAYLAMAKIYKTNKEPGKALQCLRKAVSIAPRDKACRSAMADFLGEALNLRTASLDNPTR
jgi:tetratricopeptide (TPR) repeat protein